MGEGLAPEPAGKRKTYSLSQRVVHILVAPQRTLQPPDVDTVCRFQSADLGQLDTEADFASRVLALITV